MLAWRDTAIHAKRRKPWSRGTNTTALKDYEPVLAARVSQLVDLLLHRSNGTVDLSECVGRFA